MRRGRQVDFVQLMQHPLVHHLVHDAVQPPMQLWTHALVQPEVQLEVAAGRAALC